MNLPLTLLAVLTAVWALIMVRAFAGSGGFLLEYQETEAHLRERRFDWNWQHKSKRRERACLICSGRV